MTPIRHPENAHEESYNRYHQLARHRVERCIGVLKSRFRYLRRQRILMYSPAKAGAIINSCVILHNILVENRYAIEEIDIDVDEELYEDDEEPIANSVNNYRARGNVVRNNLIHNFF